MGNATRNDAITVAAVSLLAMCLVTFDHEALGHGGLCLALGGRITLLTTSLFACEPRTILLAPAGPLMNIFMGTLALMLTGFVPRNRPALRLFLILVTAFSYFWEGGYVVQAMIERKGDMYYAFRYVLGEPSPGGRVALAIPGVILYVAGWALTSKALTRLGLEARATQGVARTVWFAATLGALAAASLSSHGWSNTRDGVMEIGLASCPLLLMSFPSLDNNGSAFAVTRSRRIIILAVVVFAVFATTMGRGLG
jgi:hypothetical protein